MRHKVTPQYSCYLQTSDHVPELVDVFQGVIITVLNISQDGQRCIIIASSQLDGGLDVRQTLDGSVCLCFAACDLLVEA